MWLLEDSQEHRDELPRAIVIEWVGALFYSVSAFLMDNNVLPGTVGGSKIAETMTASPVHLGLVILGNTLWAFYIRRVCIKFAANGEGL